MHKGCDRGFNLARAAPIVAHDMMCIAERVLREAQNRQARRADTQLDALN